MLSSLLSEVFPELLAEGDVGEAYRYCWIVKAARRKWRGLETISDAISRVNESNQLDWLKLKVRREHPLDKEHDPQHDERVIDYLNEALAFAWVVQRRLGRPKFFEGPEGGPDIRVGAEYWVEVKSIHGSQQYNLDVDALAQGIVIGGAVREAGDGLYRKFNEHFAKAIRQFKRQGSQDNNIVFFSIWNLDIASMPIIDQETERMLSWAAEKEGETPGVKIVLCYNFNWKNPFRDPWAT